MISYVAKFRVSAHKFPKETGRYINTERQNRLCTLCERGIGDELHCFSKSSVESVSREIYQSHKKNGERFSLFNETNIAMYALMCHDATIILSVSKKYTKLIKRTPLSFWTAIQKCEAKLSSFV